MEDEKNTTTTTAAAPAAKSQKDTGAPISSPFFITLDQLRNAHSDPIYFVFEEQLLESAHEAFAERIWWIADIDSSKLKCVVSGRYLPDMQEVTIVERDGVAWLEWDAVRVSVKCRLVLANSCSAKMLRDEDRVMDLAAFKKSERDWKYVKRAQIRAKGTTDLAMLSQMIEYSMYGRMKVDDEKQFAYPMTVGKRTGSHAIHSSLFSLRANRFEIVGRVDLGDTEITTHRLTELQDYYGRYAVVPITVRFIRNEANDSLSLEVQIPK